MYRAISCLGVIVPDATDKNTRRTLRFSKYDAQYLRKHVHQDGVHKVWYQNALATIAPPVRTPISQGANTLWYNAENQYT